MAAELRRSTLACTAAMACSRMRNPMRMPYLQSSKHRLIPLNSECTFASVANQHQCNEGSRCRSANEVLSRLLHT